MQSADTEESKAILDLLSAALMAQNMNDSKDSVMRSSRSSRLISPHNNNNYTNNKLHLRKRSSGSSSHYRADSDTGSTLRKRDSSGINLNNLISAVNDLHKQTKDGLESNKSAPEQDGPLVYLKQQTEHSPTHSKSPFSTQPASPHKNRIHGRIGKRSPPIPLMTNPLHTNPHDNGSTGLLSKAMNETSSIEPSELGRMLDIPSEPLMIDMRPLEMYEKSRIRHAINVNLPSLLIKRYRRGVVSNFNLESFITTPEGTEYFRQWMLTHGIDDYSIQHLPEHAKVIVYDDFMGDNEKDRLTLPSWTLMGVLSKNTSHSTNVLWLHQGFNAFQKWDFTGKYLSGTQFNRADTPPLPIPSSELKKHSPLLNNAVENTQGNMRLKMPVPMMSRSATTLSNHSVLGNGVNVQRRASLFSLDTTNVRSKNRQTQRKGEVSIENGLDPIAELKQTSTKSTAVDPLEHQPMKYTDTMTPLENEFDFTISEIIPHFLYLGPELVSSEQMIHLKTRSIQRILNMAEECDDDIPGLKESYEYTKISARDTVEMLDVDKSLKKAVDVINEAKKKHEAIYVHCKAGKSRSVAAILAYLLLSEHWTLKKAYRHLVKSRPIVSPNIGFVAELMKLEESVHGKVSNFAGTDWHKLDTTRPSSPDTQREMGRLEQSWKRERSLSSSGSPFKSHHDLNNDS